MRRTLPLALTAALVLSLAGPAAAREFDFRGGGWGHGVGLSQYGAYGLAKKGWSRGDILRTYYRNTTVETREPPSGGTFRVGLLQSRGTYDVKASRGTYEIRLSSAPAPAPPVDTVPEGQSRRITIANGAYTVKKGSTVVASGIGSSSDDLRIVRVGGAVVRVEQWGHRAGRGFLIFRIASATKAHLSVIVDSEQYLYGLGEVPSSWPAKTLEVQAIAGRTYGYRVVSGDRSGCACDILGDVRDQNYVGWDKEAGADGDRWVAAVNATAKRVVTYDGSLVTTFYSSSSGGMVESVDRVWGGRPQPHLRAGCDPGDYTSANPNRTWKTTLTSTQAATKLRNSLGRSIAKLTSIKALSRGPSGRILRARVSGRRSSGASISFDVSGESLRRALGLKSTRFWVNTNRNVTGSIRSLYDSLRCAPGLAKSSRRETGAGVWQRFAKGRIYSRSGAGTHYLHGLVLRRYLKTGGPGGRLRYPTTGVKAVDDVRVRTRFQRGTITCNRSTGRCRVS